MYYRQAKRPAVGQTPGFRPAQPHDWPPGFLMTCHQNSIHPALGRSEPFGECDLYPGPFLHGAILYDVYCMML